MKNKRLESMLYEYRNLKKHYCEKCIKKDNCDKVVKKCIKEGLDADRSNRYRQDT